MKKDLEESEGPKGKSQTMTMTLGNDEKERFFTETDLRPYPS